MAEETPLLSKQAAALVPEGAGKRRGILASFFALGAGSCITFNSVVMAVAYFKEEMGPGVLRKVAVAHDSALLLVLVVIIWFARVPSGWYPALLSGSLLVGLAFNAFVLCMVALRTAAPEALFLALIAVNGLATGVLQGLGASLAGQFDPYSAFSGAGALVLSGVGFGILFPCLTQCATLPFAATASGSAELHEVARIGAMVSAGTAAGACLLALAGVRLLMRTNIFKIVLAGELPFEEDPRRFGLGELSMGALLKMGEHAVEVVGRRVRSVAPYVVGEFVNETCIVFLMLMSPLLPMASGSSKFWSHYLATILLAVTNIMGFAGRMIATALAMQCEDENGVAICTPDVPLLLSPSRKLKRKGLVAAVLLAPLPAVIALWYRQESAEVPGIPDSNVWPVLLYGAAAFVSGFTVVSISEESHAVCGFTHMTPCPVVAQLIYLCLNLGALVGTILSFVLIR
uniref:Uncharacterized protein n=1 Tax=Phaeomonas parva TaxID=124430 RepID=A0A7S1TRP8_9STRA